jgi:integrase
LTFYFVDLTYGLNREGIFQLIDVAERIAKWLFKGETKSALDGTKGLAEEIEAQPGFQPLAHALLALGESKSIQGIARLNRARKIFLDEACFAAEIAIGETRQLRGWLERLESRLQALARSRARRVFLEPPEIQQDRLHYFLWLATRAEADHGKNVEILMPICYRALKSRLRSISSASTNGISILDDLPYQLAIFIRFFPQEQLSRSSLTNGYISYRDVEEAVDSYHKSESGIAELETRDRYVRQISETLGLDKHRAKARAASDHSGLEFCREAEEALGFDADQRITAEEDLDENGRSLGLLVWPDVEEEGYEHRYESARYIDFGAWRRGSGPRAPAYWTTRERRVVTPNELRRLVHLLDRNIKTPVQARGALLLWLALITGLPIKRLLNLRLLRSVQEVESIIELDVETAEESPIYLYVRGGVLLATPSHDLEMGGRLIPNSAYRSRACLVPMTLGERGRRYAQVAVSDRVDRDGNESFVFSSPYRPAQAMTLDNLSGTLEKVSRDVCLRQDPITWSKLSKSLHPYSVEGGLTPLLSGITTGCPTRSIITILHYVAYDACRFYADHARAVSYIERIIDQGSGQSSNEGLNLDQRIADVALGCIGASYVPRCGLVARAWAAICERSAPTMISNQAELNAATLRAAFALMVSTGIRQQEFFELRRQNLDLDSGLLRIKGKGNAYFREAREIPVAEVAINELRTYFAKIASFAGTDMKDAVFVIANKDRRLEGLQRGTIDRLILESGLGEHVPFCTRTLRHALRTELHERGASYEAVNEAFGHTVTEGTLTHQLSGGRLGRTQERFRAEAQLAASALLNS